MDIIGAQQDEELVITVYVTLLFYSCYISPADGSRTSSIVLLKQIVPQAEEREGKIDVDMQARALVQLLPQQIFFSQIPFLLTVGFLLILFLISQSPLLPSNFKPSSCAQWANLISIQRRISYQFNQMAAVEQIHLY